MDTDSSINQLFRADRRDSDLLCLRHEFPFAIPGRNATAGSDASGYTIPNGQTLL